MANMIVILPSKYNQLYLYKEIEIVSTGRISEFIKSVQTLDINARKQ